MNTTSAAQQRAAAKEFADFWKGKGYEKGQTQPFWIGLLRDVTRSHEATNDAPGTLRAFVSSCEAISQTAQAILDARARYPDASLADLYDELTMPPDLRKAHQENDRAVMAAYGFPVKTTESECVAKLFRRYQALAAKV